MRIEIIKNPEASKFYGSMFGQDVEPKGTYVLERDPNVPLLDGWLSGFAVINKPLIVNVNDNNLVEWKYDLSKEYKAKGKSLTNKLMKFGYDAIITKFSNGDSGEIILFPNSKFSLG